MQTIDKKKMFSNVNKIFVDVALVLFDYSDTSLKHKFQIFSVRILDRWDKRAREKERKIACDRIKLLKLDEQRKTCYDEKTSPKEDI